MNAPRPSLAVVAEDLGQHVETKVEAARRLEEEARQLARSASEALILDLNLIAGRCADLATLQSIPAGVRDVFRQEGEMIAASVATVQSIAVRAS